MRFGRSAWRLIQDEAKREGVSATVYVREAAVARALLDRARNNPEYGKDFTALLDLLRDD